MVVVATPDEGRKKEGEEELVEVEAVSRMMAAEEQEV